MIRRSLVALIAVSLVAGQPSWALSQFSDIPEGSRLQKAAEVLAAQGVMPGLTPTLFGGEQYLNRFSLADIASQLLGSEYVPFRVVVYADVPQGHPSLPAINRVTTVGLLKIDKGRFNGSQAVTRFELAEVLDRLLQYKSAAPPTRRSKPIQLRDVPSANPAAFAVDRVVNAWQLTDGYLDGTYRGTRPVTRFEALEMVARAASLLDPRVRQAMGPEPFAGTAPVEPAPLPAATPTPAPMATPVPTPLPTPVPTAVATPSARPTAAPTARPTPQPTPTARPIPQSTPTARPTPVPQPTSTPVAQPTVVPTPVATPTPVAATGPKLSVIQPGDDIPWMLPTPAPSRPPVASGTQTPSSEGASDGLRSPFESFATVTGMVGLFDESLPAIVPITGGQQPGVPATPGSYLQDQPGVITDTTGLGGVSAQHWWGPFGMSVDVSTGIAYHLYDQQPSGEFQETIVSEAVNLRLQGLYRFALSPGMELAVGPEGVVRYLMANRLNQQSYWRNDHGLYGGGLVARFGWRVIDPLVFDAHLGANYLYQDFLLAPLDRFGASLGLGARYEVWTSPFGPIVATLGYVGSVTAANGGTQNVHGLRLGLGMTYGR